MKGSVNVPGASFFELMRHIGNDKNPHGVTKEQIGLGNVPNVTTDNQTPTYTVAETLAELVSGEVLTVAMGKIAKAVSEIITHIANKKNPHSVTKQQLGLDKVENKSASDILGELTEEHITTALGYDPAEAVDIDLATLEEARAYLGIELKE